MRTLTNSQILIVATEFCVSRNARIRSYGALAACAAVPGSSFDGIPVYATPQQAQAALEETVRDLGPLSRDNAAFARVCGEVYRRLGESAVD